MDTTSAPADSGERVLRLTSTAGKRLFWRLNGPLETAIQVAPSEYYELGDVMEPYFGPDGSPHPVSQASILEPPVSSVTARVQCIDDWEREWTEMHRLCGEVSGNEMYPRRMGPRPDDESSEPRMYLVECCGEKRPWSYDTYLQVAAQGEFVTVHEYVTAVHPWLMAMRDTLLDVLGKTTGGPKWPPETKLAVLDIFGGSSYTSLRIGHEDKWANSHRPRPVPGPARVQLSDEERHRRSIQRVLAMSAARIRAREEEAARIRAQEEEAARVAELEKET